MQTISSLYTRRRFAALCSTGLALLFSALPSVEHSARAAERVTLAVFVAKDSSLENVKVTELRRTFMSADDSGFSGQRSVPFNHTARSPDRIGFDQTVLHMNPDEVGEFWIDRKIRGLPGPPRAVDSLSLLLHLVAHVTGGIGYARPAQVTGDVKIVRVDGKLPGEPGYGLVFEE